MALNEMIIDSIRVSSMNYQRVVMLKEKATGRYLPIWIGPGEADSIAVKIQGISVPRPLTHDCFCSAIGKLGATVKYSAISALKKDTFHAKLVLDKDDEEIEIDCRPSDAMAIAVRAGAPIFANKKVLDKAAVFLDEERGTPIGTGATVTEIESDKGEIFSQSSQHILGLAESEARRLNHVFVGTGHLLLALVKSTTPNTATEILVSHGIELSKLTDNIEAAITQRLSTESADAGLTPAVKETIKMSIEEAKQLGEDEVGEEHILIGLIRQIDGTAGDLLGNLGITVESVYRDLIRSSNRPTYRQQEPPELTAQQS